MKKRTKNVFLFVSIGLGVLAPTVELILGICSEFFFDPLPTFWHGLLYYLTPVSMFVNYFLLKMDPATEPKYVRALSRILVFFSLTVSTAYSIWFLSIIWVSILAVIFFGVGLLGLAPFALFAFSAIQNKAWLKKYDKPKLKFSQNWSFAAGALLTVLLLWTPLVTKIAVGTLDSSNTGAKTFMLKLLKNTVSRNELMEHSFYNPTMFNSWFGTYDDSDKISEAFFYIYGRKPGIPEVESGFRRNRYVWDWDNNLGTGVVGETQENLHLSDSLIDVSSDFAGGNAYTEWTMVFENDSEWNAAEARAIIQLPPDACVTKVSLWKDDVEYPAAFGGRAQVTEAYRAVVSQSRDPLLVNMIGQDLIQVECFPVPANGKMQIRIGITAPLYEGTELRLPRVVECNYNIAGDFRHKLWIESTEPLTAQSADTDPSKKIKLDMTEAEYSRMNNYFYYDAAPAATYRYFGGTLTLNYVDTPQTDEKPVLVIDGTRGVMDALSGVEWNASDFSSIVVAEPYGYSVWNERGSPARFISAHSGFGGVNPIPALEYAIDHSGGDASAIIWLHGGLPYDLSDVQDIYQYERRGSIPRIVALSVTGEFNALTANIGLMRYFRSVPSSGDFSSDMEKVMRIARAPLPETSENVLYLAGYPESGAVWRGLAILPQNSHAYRLYVFSKAMRDIYNDGEVSPANIRESIAARVVNPSVGAVVLERQSDYDNANLDPTVGEENIPSIPEPGWFWLAIILTISGTVLLIVRRKRVKAAL